MHVCMSCRSSFQLINCTCNAEVWKILTFHPIHEKKERSCRIQNLSHRERKNLLTLFSTYVLYRSAVRSTVWHCSLAGYLGRFALSQICLKNYLSSLLFFIYNNRTDGGRKYDASMSVRSAGTVHRIHPASTVPVHGCAVSPAARTTPGPGPACIGPTCAALVSTYLSLPPGAAKGPSDVQCRWASSINCII